MAREKTISENFYSISERIKTELGMRKDKDLIEALEIPQSTFSRNKENPFPAEWAYKIGRKYNLLTEWIMTGEGPKRIPQPEQPQAQQAAPQPPPTADPPTADFLVELETWAREISGHQDLRWLEKQLETCLPTWRTWREEREAKKTTTLPTDKVA